VATVSFVGYHEQRHYKQIREVLRKLGNAKRKSNQPRMDADKRGLE